MKTNKLIAEKLIEIKNKVTKIIDELTNLVNTPNIHKLVILSYFAQFNLYVEKKSESPWAIQFFNIYNNIFENSKPFSIKFNEQTLFDDFMGSVVKSELNKGNYHLNTTGFLPSSNFVFMENPSKSNNIIANDVIDLLNNNRYLNNNNYEKTSNYIKIIYDEYPWFEKNINSPSFKYFLDINIDFENFTFPGFTNSLINTKFLFSDISFVQSLVESIEIPDDIEAILKEFNAKLNEINDYSDKKIILSDHIEDIKKVIKICAILNGRLTPNITDCFFIHHLISYDINSQNLVANTFNTTSSRYEYDIQYEDNDIIFYYNNLIKLIKSEVIEKSKNSVQIRNKTFKNSVGEYYMYSTNNDDKFFIRKIVIDEILNNKNLRQMYTVRYSTLQEFLNNDFETKKIDFYLESINAFTYINNKKIALTPTTEEIKIDKYNNKNISEVAIKEIKKSSIILVQKIDYHISKLTKLLKINFNNLHSINPLILSNDMEFYKKPINAAISKLYYIRSSINEIFANLKLFVKDNNFDKMNNFTKMILL